MDCETCYYRDYDPELEEEICLMQLDQDEWDRIVRLHVRCPFYRKGDDYYLATRQG